MSRDITLCHPELQNKANRLVAECSKEGLVVKIGECFRTVAEQDALYAQGRTAPGNIVTYARGSSYSSMHQWGVAFDVIRNDGKGAYNNNDGWFDRVGKIGKLLGLEWGGDWTSPVDKPHFQLPDWGSTPTELKQLYGNVNNFKKTWEVIDMEELNALKARVAQLEQELENSTEKTFEDLETVPDWGKATVEKLIERGVLKGNGEDLDLSYTLLRLLVINDRMGLYD